MALSASISDRSVIRPGNGAPLPFIGGRLAVLDQARTLARLPRGMYGRGVTVGATFVRMEDTPSLDSLLYSYIPSVIVHKSHWHHYGSLGYSRTGLSALGRKVGLGATPLQSTDLQPRNPPLHSPVCSWFGVALSPRRRRGRSLREGSPSRPREVSGDHNGAPLRRERTGAGVGGVPGRRLRPVAGRTDRR